MLSPPPIAGSSSCTGFEDNSRAALRLKRTYGRIIVDRVVELASRRNPSLRAVSEILDRVLGKPAQAVTLDANLNVTREQRLAKVEELLAALPLPQDTNAPSDPRVN